MKDQLPKGDGIAWHLIHWRGANYRDTKTFNLKPGVRNVQVSGEAAILINTWREIFTHTFATAPVATIRVFGTTLNRKFEIK